MTGTLNDRLQAILRRIPDWLRQDLAGSEPAARERAVETLAAMMTLALEDAADQAQNE